MVQAVAIVDGGRAGSRRHTRAHVQMPVGSGQEGIKRHAMMEQRLLALAARRSFWRLPRFRVPARGLALGWIGPRVPSTAGRAP